jgi:hypothetical protein
LDECRSERTVKSRWFLTKFQLIGMVNLLNMDCFTIFNVIVAIRPMAFPLDLRLPMPLSGVIVFPWDMAANDAVHSLRRVFRPPEFIRSVHFKVSYAAA